MLAEVPCSHFLSLITSLHVQMIPFALHSIRQHHLLCPGIESRKQNYLFRCLRLWFHLDIAACQNTGLSSGPLFCLAIQWLENSAPWSDGRICTPRPRIIMVLSGYRPSRIDYCYSWFTCSSCNILPSFEVHSSLQVESLLLRLQNIFFSLVCFCRAPIRRQRREPCCRLSPDVRNDPRVRRFSPRHRESPPPLEEISFLFFWWTG